jgi:hypothetical protein
MKKLILFISLYCIANVSVAQNGNKEVFDHIPILHGDSIVFPITLINAFPLISGEVNGIKGKFMFDTGSPTTISINDNFLSLPGKKEVHKGIVGSGQTYMINTNDTIYSIKLPSGLEYNDLLNIESGNYNWLQEKITPDFIGYIGYAFFKGYSFKLDYLKRKITFYKNTEQRKSSKDFLKGEKLLGIINFETRRLPNHPLVKVKIGNIELLGSFDTGQYGLIQLEDKAKKILTAKSLVRYTGLDGHGDEQVNVNDVKIDGTFKTTIKGIYPFTMEQTTPFRKGIQITESSYICFGYRFFEQYKTVWDYEQKKIYILEK